MKLNRYEKYEHKDWLTAKQKFKQDDHGVQLLRLLQDDGHISKDIDWLSAQDYVDYGYWLHNEKNISYEELARREVKKQEKRDIAFFRKYDPRKKINI